MRRTIAGFLAVCALAVPLSISACGSSVHRALEAGWCLYAADRAYHNFKEHHLGWGAFEAALAVHGCHEAFKR